MTECQHVMQSAREREGTYLLRTNQTVSDNLEPTERRI